MPSRFVQALILGGMIILVLVVIILAVLIASPDLLPLPEFGSRPTATATRLALLPTFTPTLPPSPTIAVIGPVVTPTLTLSPPAQIATLTTTLAPANTPAPTDTPLPPTPTLTPIPSPTNPPTPAPTPVPPEPTRPAVDFVVVQQRMRSNAENSVNGVIVNNCGADHTIYAQVLDAAGQPLPGVIVGDTYKNVRAASGMDGPGRLKIELWSNTMALEVQGDVSGAAYTSEQTLPLSTRDEDIPTEWLFQGGYCGSIDECRLRQQTNGLCRGHYSYDVTFQRTW